MSVCKDIMSSIFVNYRRNDAPGHAVRLYDRLVDRFGQANVFKDLDSLEPGVDFEEIIDETIGRCDAVIAVIGQDWLSPSRDGARRLEDPQDWVRLELAHALRRRVRVSRPWSREHRSRQLPNCPRT